MKTNALIKALEKLGDESKYKEHGELFLKECHVHFEIVEAVPQDAPRWAKDGKHGIKYSVLLAKIKEGNTLTEFEKYRPSSPFFGEAIRFDYWGSLHDKELKETNPYKFKKPRAYDVLTGLEAWHQDTFEDWCFSYGYDEDSREAYATYKECKALGQKLAKVFTSEELEVLSYIN